MVLLLVLEQCLRRLRARICPPCPAAPMRAARWTASPVYGRLSRSLARVQAHPDLDLGTRRPGMGTKRELTLDCGQQRLARARERDEERVALRVDLVAA